jgi:predicted RNA binding protein with dsRBD fold (UPF0201 family)
MSKTLIAVTDFNDSVMTEYVKNQLQAISNLFPTLVIEQVNSDNSIMTRFAKYVDRVPAFFITKHGAKMASLQAKVTTEQLLDWVRSTSG